MKLNISELRSLIGPYSSGNIEACAIKQSQVYLNGLLIIWMFEETRPWRSKKKLRTEIVFILGLLDP